MKNMNKSTVDLIFADEPYNIGKDFGNNRYMYIEWNKKMDYRSHANFKR